MDSGLRPAVSTKKAVVIDSEVGLPRLTLAV